LYCRLNTIFMVDILKKNDFKALWNFTLLQITYKYFGKTTVRIYKTFKHTYVNKSQEMFPNLVWLPIERNLHVKIITCSNCNLFITSVLEKQLVITEFPFKLKKIHNKCFNLICIFKEIYIFKSTNFRVQEALY
jgi:hypothetical protein